MKYRGYLGAVVFFISLAAAFGQTDKSTIRGTITDPSRAVVPKVVITLTEVTTNISRSVASDENGNYEFPDLKPGIYRMKVDHPGFKSFQAEDLRLDTGQTRRIDVALEVGGTAETVTVEAGAAVITTETGAIAGTVDQRAFADTPLIDVYPSPLAVLTTVPGIQGAGWEILVSGQSRTQLSQGMDGIENDRTGEQTNNMNFFEEVTVTTVNNSAESSRVANYNMTSKRGANAFHGQVYYKHFNSALNARLFFDVRKTPFIQHEWMAEAGGPIIKDKTFFYAAWMAQRIPQGFFKRATVPTSLMRQGDFSQLGRTITDPLTGQPFAGNRIPSNRINAVAAKAQDLYYPQANVGGPNELTNNFGFTHPYHYDFYKGDWPFLRVDHNISEKNTIYARWLQRKTPYVLDSGLPLFVWTRLRDHRQTAISDTHIFSPSLINTFRFGWNSNYIVDGLEQDGQTPIKGGDAVKALGLGGVNAGNFNEQGFPTMSITGMTALSTVAGGARADDNDYSFEETLTWSSGRHVWKFGGDYRTFEAFDGVISNDTYGSYTFNGRFTGNGYADFLLGMASSVTRLEPLTNRTRKNKEFGVFFTDSFKVSQKLTLDYGLRWDYYALPTFTDGLMFNWDQQSGNVIVPQDAMSKIHPLYPKNIGIVTGEVVPDADMRNFRPRFSAAYRLTDTLVLRGGYGAFTERIDYFTRVLGGGPFQIDETYQWQTGQDFFTLPNPFPSSLASANVPSQSIQGYPLNTDNGTIHQYNFSVEKELATIGFRASFVGSRSAGLNYNVNINKPRASLIPFTQARRPYPQFIGATVARSDGNAHYDSLQLQAQRRVGSFTFNAHWTWANNTADYLITEDPYNLNRWARDPRDRRHYAVITTNYQVPFGKGRRWLSGAPGIVDQVLGGWMLQTISYFASGRYFSPAFSGSDPSNTGTFGGQPDRIGNGNLPPGERTVERWFDATAFRDPLPGTFGNAGANILETQGLNVHHLSIAKRFPLTERMAFTFTSAISNLFNTPHFESIVNNISVPNPGRYTSVRPDYNPEKETSRHVMLKLRLEW